LNGGDEKMEIAMQASELRTVYSSQCQEAQYILRKCGFETVELHATIASVTKVYLMLMMIPKPSL
jgi:hypothetical protein